MEGVAGQREKNEAWCQTQNSRRLSSFHVEWTALGSVCAHMFERTYVCTVETFGDHKTKL